MNEIQKIDSKSSEAKSLDITQQNIEKLKQLFPDVFTEGKVDFEALKAVLGEAVDDSDERYNFTWNGKAQARQIAQASSTGTLRPLKSKSLDWNKTENIFVEGDNLEVLKIFQKSYHKKVKVIYIDPPYNTGKDFVYKDDYRNNIKNYLKITGQVDKEGNKKSTNPETSGRFHSDWLSMMYPRLKLARNLLTDDGVIVISIDENEIHNLRQVCNEIFGEDNFCGEIIWKNSSKNDQKYISIQHEYLVVYTKSKAINKGDWLEKKEGLEEIYSAFNKFKKKHGDNWDAIHKEALNWYKQFPESNPIYSSKHYSWMDERGVYFPDNISGPNDGQYVYDVIHPLTNKPCKQPSTGWRYPESTMLERIENNLVHFGKDHTTVPNNKTYLKNTEYQSLTSLRFVDGRAASKRLEKLMGAKVFTNPKDEILLKDLFKAFSVQSNDIIMDFFAGSGSTYEAVSILNQEEGIDCKCILVQLPESLEEIYKTATATSKKVAKNAIDYLTELNEDKYISRLAVSRMKKVKGNSGFKFFYLDDTNIQTWDADSENLEEILKQSIESIKSDRSAEDVLYEILLKYGIELTVPVETEIVEGTKVFVVGAGALIVCLDDAITSEVVEGITKLKEELDPEITQVVFKDGGFADSNVKTNAIQILKQAGIDDVKSI